MTEIIKKNKDDLINNAAIDELTRHILKMPQAYCPVAHYFGPGTYIRQVTMPSGIFAIGHRQRFEQMNIFLQGRLAMLQPDGSTKEIAAPMIFTGPPGQKMGIILETVTWLNIYPNPDDERDIDILENRFLDKDGPWTEREQAEKEKRRNDRRSDRDDYKRFLEEVELTEEEIRRESEYDGDLTDMPEGFSSVITVRDSDIEGKGVFASWPFEIGQIIGLARIGLKRTQIGRYLNHSGDPNAEFKLMNNGDILLIATRYIPGCRGGDKGTELTVDYRKSYQLRIKQCQES
jgi:hypothetical protein